MADTPDRRWVTVKVSKRKTLIAITLPFKDAIHLMDILHAYRTFERTTSGCPEFLRLEARIRDFEVKEIEKKAKK